MWPSKYLYRAFFASPSLFLASHSSKINKDEFFYVIQIASFFIIFFLMRCTRYLRTAFSCTISLACITTLTPALSHPWIMLKFDPCWPMDLIQFDLCSKPSFIFFSTFYFYFILVYNTVLVLPYIDMNPPRVLEADAHWRFSQVWWHNSTVLLK